MNICRKILKIKAYTGCCKQNLSMVDRSTLLLLFFSLFFAISTHAAALPGAVPKTGQSTCYDSTGATIIICAGTGQDGDTLTGIAWPDPRFEDNDDQTITDKLTGLVWTKDAHPSGGYKTWQQALDFIKTLNGMRYLGYSDWRLPNINELESLVNKQTNLVAWLHEQGFSNVQVDYYWTSSTYASYTSYAWSVGMYSGIIAGHSKADGSYVWPVRSGRMEASTLPKTGQTACYDHSGSAIVCSQTGQDGELQAGAALPNPRFADNGDQTMTDRLTGLVWNKQGNSPGPAACIPGTNKTWQDALSYVKCLNKNNYQGKSDWRLPNRNELASLVNHGQPNSAAWLNTLGFSHVQASNYWSSSTYDYTRWNAWSINMHDGAVTSCAKKRGINVWPVRSGQ